MEKSLILAMTTVSACLPSIATVRVQRIEQDPKQTRVLTWCGLIALITILGALYYEPLMWFGVMLMVATYLYFMFAPKSQVV